MTWGLCCDAFSEHATGVYWQLFMVLSLLEREPFTVQTLPRTLPLDSSASKPLHELMFQNRLMCLCSCVLYLCVQCLVYGAACIYSSVVIQTALLGAGQCHYIMYFLFEGISSSMNFDEEEDDEDEVSSSSSQLNSNTRPGSATSKKSCKVHYLMLCGHLLIPDSWMELLLYTQCALMHHLFALFLCSAGLSH